MRTQEERGVKWAGYNIAEQEALLRVAFCILYHNASESGEDTKHFMFRCKSLLEV
jgi:hypothetical protein